MPDEYQVPALIAEVRAARATMTTSEVLKALPPSLLYHKAEQQAEQQANGLSLVRLLYNHAFVEAGYILNKSREKGGVPYAVCPVCGYVFP
jgi:hypothetical protein